MLQVRRIFPENEWSKETFSWDIKTSDSSAHQGHLAEEWPTKYRIIPRMCWRIVIKHFASKALSADNYQAVDCSSNLLNLFFSLCDIQVCSSLLWGVIFWKILSGSPNLCGCGIDHIDHKSRGLSDLRFRNDSYSVLLSVSYDHALLLTLMALWETLQ